MLIFSYRLLQLIIFPVVLIIGLIRILNEKDPETIIKELEGVKKNFSEAVLY